MIHNCCYTLSDCFVKIYEERQKLKGTSPGLCFIIGLHIVQKTYRMSTKLRLCQTLAKIRPLTSVGHLKSKTTEGRRCCITDQSFGITEDLSAVNQLSGWENKNGFGRTAHNCG